MTVWQFAAGEGEVDYSEECFTYGLALVGPGELGKFDADHRQEHIYRGHKHNSLILAEGVKEGDLLVLKQWKGPGHGDILGVAKVIGPYEYKEHFQDVQGWDVQHARRVEWHRVSYKNHGGVARGTLTRAKGEMEDLTKHEQVWEAPIVLSKQMPPLPDKVSDDKLVSDLVQKGLRVSDAESVALALKRVRYLAKWYRHNIENFKIVSEAEVHTNLVAPLLSALGWPEQRMKIQWRKTDVSLFDKVVDHNNPKAQDHCIGVVEIKRMGRGFEKAVTQAKKYADRFPKCRWALVTDGISYMLYEKAATSWKTAPTAHCNVLCPRERHPYMPDVAGAIQLFETILPSAL